MLVSEVLGTTAYDQQGTRLGTVIDVRLYIEGDLDHDPRPPTVLGVVISPHTRGSYLGYGRTEAEQPVVLAKLQRWRHRGTFLCAWPDVVRLDPDRIVVRDAAQRFSPILQT
jgi:sporulation protein YlmC with PRC-barrel domain